MRRIALSFLAAAAFAPQLASAADVLAIDLFDPVQLQTITYASPTTMMTTVDVRPHIPSNLRAAFSADEPLELPCDVSFLASGLSWENVGDDTVFVELSAIATIGGESARLADRFGSTEPKAPEYLPLLPGAVGTGGLIWLAPAPLISYTTDANLADASLAYMDIPGYGTPGSTAYANSAPGYFPENESIKLRYRLRAFSDTVYDFQRGGFDTAFQVPDSAVWDDCYVVWVRRSCPAD